MTDLPIEPVLPELKTALRAGPSAVLEAPPGAGKTTRVPLALLDEPWLRGDRIIMLEPRRLAARAAARRMAALLGEAVGETVGYRVRLDTRVGARTRIEVVTEGVLTRMLQSDPSLERVGLVIFDEFHERNVHADLGLALCLQSRAVLRPELRVLVMSATLDGASVTGLLGGITDPVARGWAVGESEGAGAGVEPTAGTPGRGSRGQPAPAEPVPVIRSQGRVHPVRIYYLDRLLDSRVEPAVACMVRRVLSEESGDVLVFLPGAGEIRRVQALLEDRDLPAGVRLAPLHGSLPEEAQDRAIAPSPPGERKVVLATNIAETSLTIEGIRVVVDAGLVRVPRFSPRTGMTRLETVTVSAASAEQRRGRAGRLGPGVCYRLWTEAEQRQLSPHLSPEIRDADLAPVALELAAWGVGDPAELAWLDPPPPAAYAQARELLRWLGALDVEGAITGHGRRMAELGLHPRLAHMALRGTELGHGLAACDLAAVLGGRDFLRRSNGAPDADLRVRLEALRDSRRRGGGPPRSYKGHDVHAGGLARALREAGHWRRRLRIGSDAYDAEACGLLLAHAYPDRIAQRRAGSAPRFLLRNGRGTSFRTPDPLGAAPWLVVADLHDTGREGTILLAAPIDREELEAHFSQQVERQSEVAWEPEARAVRARRRERLGALVLEDVQVGAVDPELVVPALLDGIHQEGLGLLPWTKGARRLRERLAFLNRLEPDAWPDVSDNALLGTLPDWLGPYIHGMRSADHLKRLDLAGIVMGLAGWERKELLEALAPDRIEVPSGSRIPIDYSDPAAPVLAARIQEVFGLRETPRIAGGRVPLTLHLLSPARRPVQVTRDLASFWRDAYFEVRKDLRGRYPKHDWPEDPREATATRGVRRRG